MSKRRSPAASVDHELPHEVKQAQLAAVQSAKKQSGTFAIGQRWASEMEPELGLGTITAIEHRRITISFQEGACVRQYAVDAAPLKRVRFRQGDTIQSRESDPTVVMSVREESGVLVYETAAGDLPEPDLSDQLRFTAPLDRLPAADTDSLDRFRLRLRTLALRERIDGNPARGFAGPRIDLIPHQLYIAQEVSSRHIRRVLLSDEVGLGKTIEACLILHRLLVTGRLHRALILVPESLVHIWFVELIRKFNLPFRIYDRDFFEEISPEAPNPFLSEQLIITSAPFLKEQWAGRCVEAGWDMVIVDEAHHLRQGTFEFGLVEALSGATHDLLLLTATPSQYGEENHFARLRLLDPSRYGDYDSFIAESRGHRRIAQITARLLDMKPLDESDAAELRTLFGESGETLDNLAGAENRSRPVMREIVARLLDRHGVGRAVFRNTRASVGGFPPRVVEREHLEAGPEINALISREVLGDIEGAGSGEFDYSRDPRIEHIAKLLRDFSDDKFLLICRSREKVTAIDEALKKNIGVNVAVFHEELSLLQRDRNAAYFAEEDGARILLCSEIGSEGRNFQFAHHLILFDLPVNPELIEQRIGRLDRIGQRHPVRIHVLCINGTPQEVLVRWHDEGIGVFSSNIPAAAEVFDALGGKAVDLIRRIVRGEKESWNRPLSLLITRTRTLTEEINARLADGRDRLLEQHSFRPGEASKVAQTVSSADGDESLDSFMIELFRSVGIVAEQFGPRTYRLWSEASLDQTFPGLRGQRQVVTFSRSMALAREDVDFLSIDHPAVTGGIDILLGSEQGNCCLAQWKRGADSLLLLEAVFVLEAIAPPQLTIGRFLPPTPLCAVVDHRLRDRIDMHRGDYDPLLVPWDGMPVLDKPDVKMRLIPAMEKKASLIAQEKARVLIEKARAKAQGVLDGEVSRLEALRRVNPSVSPEEIDRAKNERDRIDALIRGASPRLDAVRLIYVGQGRSAD